MRRQPPHSFRLFGKTWRVKFVDPVKALTKKEREQMRRLRLELQGLTVSARTTKRRDIYIHPRNRTNWRVFAHEVIHSLEEEMAEHRREKGWKKRPLTHDQIEKLAEPFASFLQENL